MRSKASSGLLLIAAAALALPLAAASPATAATSVQCSAADFSCLSFSGYGAYTNTWADGYYLAPNHNCTRYAAYRLARNGVGNPGTSWGNAWEWWTRAPGTKNTTPAVGAIAYFSAAWTSANAGHGSGHVAYVEEVRGDGSIVVTEDNWGSNSRRVVYSGAQLPSGYIHIADQTAGPIGNGTFITVAGRSEVYRVAGGAPIYVSSWDAYGGAQSVRTVSQAEFNALAAYPADGTFIVGGRRGEVYRIAGGAPLYVSAAEAVGGIPNAIKVDDWSIDNAGNAASHLRARPADGTLLRGGRRGEIYVVAGGAPIYVWSPGNFRDLARNVVIDDWAVDHPENPKAHLSARPADGTFLRGYTTGRIYRVQGGVPTYVPSWDPYGGPKPYVDVDQTSIDRAGNPLTHLTAPPATTTPPTTTPPAEPESTGSLDLGSSGS